MNNELKEPWGESILDEHKALKEKLYKLIEYINSEEYYSLSPNAKKVITNQKTLLETYINTLSTKLYEDIDKVFITDYSMLGLLFSTFTGNFSSCPSTIPTPPFNTETVELSEKDFK